MENLMEIIQTSMNYLNAIFGFIFAILGTVLMGVMIYVTIRILLKGGSTCKDIFTEIRKHQHH